MVYMIITVKVGHLGYSNTQTLLQLKYTVYNLVKYWNNARIPTEICYMGTGQPVYYLFLVFFYPSILWPWHYGSQNVFQCKGYMLFFRVKRLLSPVGRMRALYSNYGVFRVSSNCCNWRQNSLRSKQTVGYLLNQVSGPPRVDWHTHASNIEVVVLCCSMTSTCFTSVVWTLWHQHLHFQEVFSQNWLSEPFELKLNKSHISKVWFSQTQRCWLFCLHNIHRW